jgi:hypothetical protein
MAKAATIVSGGKTDYVIALCSRPIPSEQTAAKELQSYLEKSTGVLIPIVGESSLTSSQPAIMVGPTVYARSKGIMPKGEEDWTIKTVGNRLVLTGGRPRGTLYSVYHFLEDHVGIRWWTMWEESVPKLNKLTISSIDRSGSPGFIYRDIYDAEIGWPKEFYVRNRVNGMFSFIPWEYGGTVQYGPPYHVHTFSHYFPASQYFKTHPEYFSMSGGKRIDNGQLCLTNKDMQREWIVKMKEYIRSSYAEADKAGVPRPSMYSISQNDWAGSCECENCKPIYEKEGHAGLELMFVNEVADEIAKVYPDVLIDTLAYSFYAAAPKTIKPRPNVCIRVCDDPGDVLHGMGHPNNREGLKTLKDWSKITNHLRIWDYGVIYTPNLPTPTQLYTAADMKLFKKLGVEGVFTELENVLTTDMWDMKAWMLAKTMEDPNANSGKLVKEFTDGYYGTAGRYVREYLNIINKALNKRPVYINFGGNPAGYTFLDVKTVSAANAAFDKAESAAAGDPVLLDRVQFARTSLDRAICLRYRNLYRENSEIPDAKPLTVTPKISGVRAANILRKMAQQRFPSSPQWTGGALAEATLLESISEAVVVAPIPEQLKGYKKDDIVDFPSDMFRLWSNIKIVKDTESAYGLTCKLAMADTNAEERARYMITDAQPMPMGHYNPKDRVFGGSTGITPKDIESGYNLYKFGPFKMKPSEYFYLFWSWNIQMDLDAIRSDDPNQEYEVYASIKFEGPSFPSGDPSRPDAICVDRIIAVRVAK